MPLRQPPYTRDLLRGGFGLWFYFGSAEAWERVQRRRALGWRNALLLPPGTRPDDYDWSCLRDESLALVELAETSRAFRHHLVCELARYDIAGACLLPHSRSHDDLVLWDRPPTPPGATP